MKKINIAYIPARSGSVTIKDKNIKTINGKPLIYWTIKAAVDSKCFGIVYVSTDSKKYAQIAKRYGANCDFLRSKANSSNTASTIDGVIEAINQFKNKGYKINTITILQPTSPLRDKQDIINAFKIYKSKKASSVISISSVIHPSFLINTLNKNKNMHNFVSKQNLHIRRQDFKQEYYVNGAIYILSINSINNWYDKKSYAYIMNYEHSIDINTSIDFKIAELLLKTK